MMITFIDVLLWIVYLMSLYFVAFWLLVFLDPRRSEEDEKRIKIKEWPLVCVGIPAYNEQDTIEETLNSVLKLDYPKEKLEIVVVNDGSKDKTSEIVEQIIKKNKSFNIKLINQKNKGKAAAMNVIVKSTKAKFFASLDADSFVTKKALKKLLVRFTDEKIASVIPVLKVESPKSTIQRIQWYEYLVNTFYKKLMSSLNCLHVTPGPFSIYRTKVIKEVGYYDESNLVEDLELALKVQKKHYKITQVLDAEVYTHAPKNIKQLYKQRNRWYKGSIFNVIKHKELFGNKRYGDFGLMQVPMIILSGILAIVMVGTFLHYLIKPMIEYFYNMGLVNFDFMTFIRNIQFDFLVLDLTFSKVTMLVFMIFISLFVMTMAHRYTNEKILKHGKIYGVVSLFSFMFIYYLILGIMWMGITIDLIIGKKQKW